MDGELSPTLDVVQALDSQKFRNQTHQDIAQAIISIRQNKLPDPRNHPRCRELFLVSSEVAEKLVAEHPSLPHYPQPDGRVKLAAGWLIEHAGWKGKTTRPRRHVPKNKPWCWSIMVVQRLPMSTRTMAAVQSRCTLGFGVKLTPEPGFFFNE